MALTLALAGCAGSGRTVRERELTSSVRPEMRLVAAEGFHFVGHFYYMLESGYHGDRYVFADTAGQALRRLLVVQFAEVPAGSTENYHVNLAYGDSIGGQIGRASRRERGEP